HLSSEVGNWWVIYAEVYYLPQTSRDACSTCPNKEGCVFYLPRTSRDACSIQNEEILRGAKEGCVFYPQ
ncbi:MAG: hypothetical protein ACPGWR_28475, partial [Ardenticatenaceae bacterium]